MSENQKNKVPEEILEQLLSVDPETVYARGYASWQEGDYSRAVIDFSWLVMAQPWSWRAHIALAGAWMMLKRILNGHQFLWPCIDAGCQSSRTGLPNRRLSQNDGGIRAGEGGFPNCNQDELCGCLME